MDGDGPYNKLIDVGRQLIANRISGFTASRVLHLLQNLAITPRPIWLTRHGESEFNVQGRIGGDSQLSPRGATYAQRLGAFMESLYPSDVTSPDGVLTVWTSCLRRTQLTATPYCAATSRQMVAWKALDEIDAGVFDGLTYEAIAEQSPEDYAARAKNKFGYRYPRGESYADMVGRLEPVLVEMSRYRAPLLIVSHQATLRVLYAYLTDRSPDTCPELLIPLHTVIQLTPRAYGSEEVRHRLSD